MSPLARCLRLGVAGVVLSTLVSGCFGDWVSARPRPQRDAAEPSVSPKLDAVAPADSCEAYVAAVAERCDAVLEGHLGHCHRELLQVMALWHEGNAPLGHRGSTPSAEDGGRRRSPNAATDPPAESRADACARHLRGLPEPPRRDAASRLGPECRAWGQALRERCVAPLSTIPPDLRRCGPDLPAFESFVGAITFGRPADHEPSCRDAVLRLRRAADELGPSATPGDDPSGVVPAGSSPPAGEDRESSATKAPPG